MAPSTWRRRPTLVREEAVPGEAAWWLHRCLSHLCIYRGWMAPCGSGSRHHPCRHGSSPLSTPRAATRWSLLCYCHSPAPCWSLPPLAMSSFSGKASLDPRGSWFYIQK